MQYNSQIQFQLAIFFLQKTHLLITFSEHSADYAPPLYKSCPSLSSRLSVGIKHLVNTKCVSSDNVKSKPSLQFFVICNLMFIFCYFI